MGGVNRTVLRFALALVSLTVLLGACATVPDGRRPAAPVVSWPGSPADTAAISWHAPHREAAIELVGPDGGSRFYDARETRGFASVELDGLAPGSVYRYRVAGEERWHSFRTLPAAPERLSFAIVGDLQPFNEETDRTTSLVVDKVSSLAPDFVLQMGDIAEIGILESSWRRAIAILSGLAAETPVVPVAGNHDYYYGIPSARIFKSVFPIAYADDAPRRNTWHSVTVGPLHIAVLDTEADGERFDRQLAWLADDLRAARNAEVPWIFVAMHRPILASTVAREDPRWARELFGLFSEFGVDAAFWGHDHLFEHYAYTHGANGLVFKEGDSPADGPVHLFTTGSAGSRIDALYPGFFTHRPFREERTFISLDDGGEVTRVFVQRPWQRERAKTEGAGVRYQDPSVYPKAASYFSFPFDDAAAEAAEEYSDDPSVRYSDDADFYGYTYGETSIHYLWVEVTGERCTVTAHYADGDAGEHGTVITTPTGTPMRFELGE